MALPVFLKMDITPHLWPANTWDLSCTSAWNGTPYFQTKKVVDSVPGILFLAGWWFGTFFIFHNIWDNPSH